MNEEYNATEYRTCEYCGYVGPGAIATSCGEHGEVPLIPRCTTCECTGDDVTFAPNDAAVDLFMDDTFVWMCELCRYQAAMDV